MRCDSRRRLRGARAALIAAALGAGAAATVAHPGSARAQAGNAAATTQAAEAFARGRAAFERGAYEAALAEFRAAIALVPSPNTRLYVARSLRNLGRNAEAYAAFVRAAAEADERAAAEPRYAPTAVAARADARGLLPRVAMANVSVVDPPPGAALRLNGSAVDPAHWGSDLPFEPGSVEVDATAPGRAPYHSSAPLAAGVVTRIEVRLGLASNSGAAGGGAAPLLVTPEPMVEPPRAPRPRVDPATGWARSAGPPPGVPPPPPRAPASPLVPVGAVAVSLGLAAGIGAIIAGAAAQSLYDEIRRMCGEGPCAADTEGLQQAVERGRTRVALANVGIGVSAGLVALGAVLIVAGRAAESAAASAAAHSPPHGAGALRRDRRAPGARVTVSIDPLGRFAGVQGVF